MMDNLCTRTGSLFLIPPETCVVVRNCPLQFGQVAHDGNMPVADMMKRYDTEGIGSCAKLSIIPRMMDDFARELVPSLLYPMIRVPIVVRNCALQFRQVAHAGNMLVADMTKRYDIKYQKEIHALRTFFTHLLLS